MHHLGCSLVQVNMKQPGLLYAAPSHWAGLTLASSNHREWLTSLGVDVGPVVGASVGG
jgi:predicted oxidoreductase